MRSLFALLNNKASKVPACAPSPRRDAELRADCAFELRDELFLTKASIWAHASPFVAEVVLSSVPVSHVCDVSNNAMLPVFALPCGLLVKRAIFELLFDAIVSGLELNVDSATFEALFKLSLQLHVTCVTFALIEKALFDRERTRTVMRELVPLSHAGLLHHAIDCMVRRSAPLAWIADDVVPRATLQASLIGAPLSVGNVAAMADAAAQIGSAALLARCTAFLIADRCAALLALRACSVRVPTSLWRALLATQFVDVLAATHALAVARKEKAVIAAAASRLKRLRLG